VSIVLIRNGPSLQFLKVGNDKRLAGLKAFGQPLRKRKGVPILVLSFLEREDAESRELHEWLPQAQELLSRTVWRDHQRRRLRDHVGARGMICLIARDEDRVTERARQRICEGSCAVSKLEAQAVAKTKYVK
jgi:hypothetical protein